MNYASCNGNPQHIPFYSNSHLQIRQNAIPIAEHSGLRRFLDGHPVCYYDLYQLVLERPNRDNMHSYTYNEMIICKVNKWKVH